MKQYEKNLKKLIRLSHVGGRLVSLQESGLSEEEARRLEAMGLVSLRSGWESKYHIELQRCGITYFHDKQTRREEFWREHIVSFVGGFAAGVLTTLVSSWLIQRLL